LILLVPKDLIATADGQANRAIGIDAPNEIATVEPS
jgi:hypothetical protein